MSRLAGVVSSQASIEVVFEVVVESLALHSVIVPHVRVDLVAVVMVDILSGILVTVTP